MKTNIIKLICGFVLLGAVASASAQSICNYVITPSGSTNSLVTWSVTGSITGSPGVVFAGPYAQQLLGQFTVVATNLFISSYTAQQGPSFIPTPDGSDFHNIELGQNFQVTQCFASIYQSSDFFGLTTSFAASPTAGQHVTYDAGSESTIILIPYSDFNPGTYQTIDAAGTFFDTPLTVNLTVGAVPEPSTMALAAMGGFSTLLLVLRGRK